MGNHHSQFQWASTNTNQNFYPLQPINLLQPSDKRSSYRRRNMYETKIDRYTFKNKQRGNRLLGKRHNSALKERAYYGGRKLRIANDITGSIIR